MKFINFETLRDLKPHLSQINVIVDNSPLIKLDLDNRDITSDCYYYEIISPRLLDRNTLLPEVILATLNITLKDSKQVKQLLQILNTWLQYIDPGITVKIQKDVFTWYYKETEITPSKGLILVTSAFIEIIVKYCFAPSALAVFYWDSVDNFLHPDLIIKLGTAITKICNQYSDLTLILTSNDECFCNGIRLGVKQKHIQPGKVKFFYHDSNQSYELLIDKNGNLSEYPNGCLDTLDRSFLALLKP